MEKGLTLPRWSVPQSDQAQLARLGRDNGPARTRQSTYTVGAAQQVPLHTCAACTGTYSWHLTEATGVRPGTTD